ncbi:hypothetical protein [Halorubrum sp. Ea8]|uniref:hypothetical protein n=1 Tax=Halorubrum sp. Ea8 TaxID=1383841 RepID=UPI000B98D0F8|nr:hypothetical protein [Halorubrum sp. Ea8]OYR47360.1 hypothetical protein DJ74_13240 [Halorubrum sp. Ea8]
MTLALSIELTATIAVVVAVAGAANGVAGFDFAAAGSDRSTVGGPSAAEPLDPSEPSSIDPDSAPASEDPRHRETDDIPTPRAPSRVCL